MRLIILAILIYILYRLVRGFFRAGQALKKAKGNGIIREMVQDPYCKTYIPIKEAKRKVIKRKEYFFCSKECAEKFEKE
jgi:YHS domain-containing protein